MAALQDALEEEGLLNPAGQHQDLMDDVERILAAQLVMPRVNSEDAVVPVDGAERRRIIVSQQTAVKADALALLLPLLQPEAQLIQLVS